LQRLSFSYENMMAHQVCLCATQILACHIRHMCHRFTTPVFDQGTVMYSVIRCSYIINYSDHPNLSASLGSDWLIPLAWSFSLPYTNHSPPNTPHFNPEDGVSMFPQNVGTFLPLHMVSQFRDHHWHLQRHENHNLIEWI
jgi:hypothetical protein